jgi:hypothetical protein
MTIDAVMDLVESLEGTTVVPHFDRLAARTKRRMYLTWPRDGLSVNVLLGDSDVTGPGLSPLWWGKKRVGLQVDLAGADDAQLEALIRAAWARK